MSAAARPVVDLLRLSLAMLFVLLAMSVGHAQDAQIKTLDAVRAGLDDINKALKAEDLDNAALNELGAAIPPLRLQAEEAAAAVRPQLDGIDARLAQIGAPPAEGAPPEGPEVTAERDEQTKLRQSFDEVARRARLLQVEADQVLDSVRERQRNLFRDRVFIRSRTVLSPGLWLDAIGETPRHTAAIGELAGEFFENASANYDHTRGVFLLGALAAAIVVSWPVRNWVHRRGQQIATEQVPGSRLRRSSYALVNVIVSIIMPGVVTLIVYFALTAANFVPERLEPLLRSLLWLTVFVFAVNGLGRAILSWGRPSWRLPAISDEVAQRLRIYPGLIGVIVGIGAAVQRFNELIIAGIASTIVVNAVIALSIAAVYALALRAARIGHEEAEQNHNSGEDEWILGVGRLAAWVAIAVVVISVATGFTAFAVFLANQIVWITVVGALLYLLLTFVDDLMCGEDALSPVARMAREVIGIRTARFAQFCVLLSGVIRVALIFFAILLVLAPWGFQSGDALGWVRRVFMGFELAGFSISPSTIFSALVILAVGVLATRLVQGWLQRRYLPQTRMDDGLKNSISTGIGYAGIILAAGFALSTLGLGLDRLAIVAGALSVGIGFGLQSIVSNFVSGLILLAERPVRVGDWVKLGTDQGNVKRIAVRSTVIEMFDRSTLIVPNSDLITKPVRNFTHQNPLGRVRLNIGVGHDSDVAHIKDVLLGEAREHANVLPTPAPSVTLIGLTDTGIGFSLFCYVATPRQASDTQSDLYFAVLQRLQKEGVKIAAPPAV